MFDSATYETNESLIKTNKVCKFISAAMKVVFALLVIWWVYTIGIMILTLINPNILNNVSSVSVPATILYVVYGAVMAVICVTLIRMFSDAAKGSSPFTLLQVKRLRLIAATLLVYAFLEFAITCSATFMQQSMVSLGQASVMGGAVATINLAPLIAAAVIFAFSFVFKYGVLLQEFSDETL